MRSRFIAGGVAAMITIAGAASLAGAKRGVDPAAGGVRSALTLVGGEEPSLPGAIEPAAADARFTGRDSKIGISTMDSARFPVQVRNQANQNVAPCVANVAIGSLTGIAPVTPDPVTGKATAVAFTWNAPSSAGAATSIDIVCDWTDRKGVHSHHETHWAGTL